jgi:membrane protein YdbS with pleckstrin-like domain
MRETDLEKPLPLGLALLEGETIAYRTRTWFRAWYWIVALLIVTIPFVLFRWLRSITVDYAVTNRRVIVTKGILVKNQRVLDLAKIQNVSMRQGPLGRWWNYGDVLVETAGEVSAERVPDVDAPKLLRDAILNQKALGSGRDTAL